MTLTSALYLGRLLDRLGIAYNTSHGATHAREGVSNVISLINLDAQTRKFMLDEIDSDIAQGKLYISDRLSGNGRNDYPDLLKGAAQSFDDAWLAAELRHNSRLNPSYQRRNPRGGPPVTVTMPRDAHETMAEGEFNRFYMRGLCERALSQNIPQLIVYRAKQVMNPRPASVAREGMRIDAAALLADLRANIGLETFLGVPGGPNSGLSVRLP